MFIMPDPGNRLVVAVRTGTEYCERLLEELFSRGYIFGGINSMEKLHGRGFPEKFFRKYGEELAFTFAPDKRNTIQITWCSASCYRSNGYDVLEPEEIFVDEDLSFDDLDDLIGGLVV